MNRKVTIALVLALLSMGAGAWAGVASRTTASAANNGFLQPLTSTFAALARITAGMTETSILLCLGIFLIVLAQVLQKFRLTR